MNSSEIPVVDWVLALSGIPLVVAGAVLCKALRPRRSRADFAE
jgi:hypothetical protein